VFRTRVGSRVCYCGQAGVGSSSKRGANSGQMARVFATSRFSGMWSVFSGEDGSGVSLAGVCVGGGREGLPSHLWLARPSRLGSVVGAAHRGGSAGWGGQWLTPIVNRSTVAFLETNASFNNQRDIPLVPAKCGTLATSNHRPANPRRSHRPMHDGKNRVQPNLS